MSVSFRFWLIDLDFFSWHSYLFSSLLWCNLKLEKNDYNYLIHIYKILKEKNCAILTTMLGLEFWFWHCWFDFFFSTKHMFFSLQTLWCSSWPSAPRTSAPSWWLPGHSCTRGWVRKWWGVFFRVFPFFYVFRCFFCVFVFLCVFLFFSVFLGFFVISVFFCVFRYFFCIFMFFFFVFLCFFVCFF